MGSGGSQQVSQNVNTSQQYTPNPLTNQFAQGVMGLANSLPGAPQVPLQGISPWNPAQAQAYANVGNTFSNPANNPANPYFNAGSNYISQSASPQQILGNTAAYYNPLASSVMAQMQNLFGMQQQQNTGNLVQSAGGVGADRVAVGQGNLANQQTLAAGQTLAGLWQQAQNQAQATAGLQQGAGALSYAAGPAALQSYLTGNAALYGSGQQAQQQAQNLLNAYFQQQTGQYQNPFQRLGAGTATLGTVAPALGGNTTGQQNSVTNYPAPSMLSQIAGLGMSGLGLLGGTGAFGQNGWMGPMMSSIGSGLSSFGSGIGSMFAGASPFTAGAGGKGAAAAVPFLMNRGGGINPYKFADGGQVVEWPYNNLGLEPFNTHQPGGYEPPANVDAVARGVQSGKVKILRPEGKADGGPSYPMATGWGGSFGSGIGGSGTSAIMDDINKMMLGRAFGTFGTKTSARGGPIKAADGASIPGLPGIPDIGGGTTDASPYFMTPQMQQQQMLRLMMMQPQRIDPFAARFNPATSVTGPRPYPLHPLDQMDPNYDPKLNPRGPDYDPNDPRLIGVDPTTRGDPSTVGGGNFAFRPVNQPLPSPSEDDARHQVLSASGRPPGYVPGSADAYMPPGAPPPAGGTSGQFAANPWMGLLMAGLGTLAASGQRDARGLPLSGLGAIGAGGMRGIQFLDEQRKQALAEKAEYDRNYQEAQQRLQQAQFHEDTFSRMTKAQELEANKPFLIGYGKDYMPIYGVRDVNTPGGFRIVDPSSMLPGKTGATGTNTPPTDTTEPTSTLPPSRMLPQENFSTFSGAPTKVEDRRDYKYLGTLDPEMQSQMRAVDEGRLRLADIPAYAGKAGVSPRTVIARNITRYDPDYEEAFFDQRKRQMLDMDSNGNAGKMLLATNQLIPHLAVGSDAALDMDNKNILAGNRIKNWVSTEVQGDPEVKRFNAVREVAAMDAARLLRGSGQMAEKDIEFWRDAFSNADSPRQLNQLFATLGNDLIGARVDSIAHSYRQMTRTNPPALVSQEARDSLFKLIDRRPIQDPKFKDIEAPMYSLLRENVRKHPEMKDRLTAQFDEAYGKGAADAALASGDRSSDSTAHGWGQDYAPR